MSYRIANRLTFIHIGKTAGTSITRLIKEKYKHTFSGQQHDGWNDLPLQWRDRVFCVVRNPYQRALSYYTFAIKVLNDKSRRQRFPERVKNQLRELDRGFKHFIFNCQHMDLAKSPDKIPSHWYQTKQLDQLPNDLALIKILRMESLQAQFSELMKHEGLPHHQLPRNNVSADNTEYRKYYDDETRKEVEKHYGKDIEVLGYKF